MELGLSSNTSRHILLFKKAFYNKALYRINYFIEATMTFKHAKFEDSVIMRSLERVAREKGMIKDEPLQKTASTNLNLSPSDSLMESILNLCAGLRVSGFSKYADELETNYLAYKRATNELYQTDEKAGEKEVQTAHPDGSHKLEGVLGDDLAVVEDILDRHLKMLEVVDKKPHGKLESSAEVLSAVKKALGQDAAPTAPVAPKTPEALVSAGVDKMSPEDALAALVKITADFSAVKKDWS